MPAVALEDDDVAGGELERLPPGYERDAAALAREVLARAGRVRHADEARARRQRHTADLDARQLLRQESANRRVAALADPERVPPVETSRRPPRSDRLVYSTLAQHD